jgi:hypothetical protein
MRYLTFATPPYRSLLNVMLDSFRAFRIEGLEVLTYDDNMTWEFGNYHKVELILQRLRDGQPLIWMDCDTMFLKPPDWSFTDGWGGICCRGWPSGTVAPGTEYACGVMYFGPDSLPIVEEWSRRCKLADAQKRIVRFADQSIFCEMILEMGWQDRIRQMPSEYNIRVSEIVDKVPVLADPVIFHMSQRANTNREYMKSKESARDCRGWPTGVDMIPPTRTSLRRPTKPHTVDLIRTLRGEIEPDGLAIEVGSCYGENAYHLMRELPIKRLFCIDPWHPVGMGKYAQKCFNGLHQQDIAGKRVVKDRRGSPAAASRYQDKAFEFIYIDGDHSHGAVSKDLDAWWPKVRVGGFLCGHDWADLWGDGVSVRGAVEPWARVRGLQVEVHEDGNNWYIRKVSA